MATTPQKPAAKSPLANGGKPGANAPKVKTPAPTPAKPDPTKLGGGASTEVGALLPAGSLAPGADTEKVLAKNYAGAWTFWTKGDTLDPVTGEVVKGDRHQFLDNAIANKLLDPGASPEAFNNALEQASWYSDPTTGVKAQGLQASIAQYTQANTAWADSLSNREQDVRNMAKQLGYQLDDATVTDTATKSLYDAYDSSYFDSSEQQDAFQKQVALAAIAAKAPLTGGAQGLGVDAATQLRNYAQSQGINVTDDYINNAVNSVNDKSTNLDYWQNDLKSKAASNWSAYSDKINGGQTLKSLVDPYLTSMQNILGTNPNTVDLANNKYIKMATGLTTSPDGTSQPMPIWQFENQLRQDPTWQYTTDAHNQIADAGSQILKNWGLMG